MGEVMRIVVMNSRAPSNKMLNIPKTLATFSSPIHVPLSTSRCTSKSSRSNCSSRAICAVPRCFNATRSVTSDSMLEVLQKSSSAKTLNDNESLVSILSQMQNLTSDKSATSETNELVDETKLVNSNSKGKNGKTYGNDELLAYLNYSRVKSDENSEAVSLTGCFKLDLINAECDELLALENNLFWDPPRMHWALGALKQVFAAHKAAIQNSITPPEETLGKIRKCRALMCDRLSFNRDVFVFEKVIKDSKFVAELFDETNIKALTNFVCQFESLELPEGFSLSNLVSLIQDFQSFLKGDVTFLNLSPDMIKLINNGTANSLVSVLDTLSKAQCRSPNILDHVCKALGKMELPRAKLRAACFSLSQLNYFDAKIMEMAVSSLKSELKSRTPSTATVAVSFLTICRKLRFRDMDLVNCIATRMIPILKDLLDESSNAIQNQQNMKMFAEFINCIASLNVPLEKIQVNADVLKSIDCGNDDAQKSDFTDLMTKCIARHGSALCLLTLYKSLCILDLLTEDLFEVIKPNVISSFQSIRTEDSPLGSYERFCSNLILAHACLRKFPSALAVREDLQSYLEDFVTVKRSEIILSDASRHVRYFFERIHKDVEMDLRLSQCVEFGYVADFLESPSEQFKIVALCPTMSDSINLFEDLKGEKALELRHLEELGHRLFLVDPRHWAELQGDHEKAEYLEVKWALEFGLSFKN